MALKKGEALPGRRPGPSLAAGTGRGSGYGSTLRGLLRDWGLALSPKVAGTFHGLSQGSTELGHFNLRGVLENELSLPPVSPR